MSTRVIGVCIAAGLLAACGGGSATTPAGPGAMTAAPAVAAPATAAEAGTAPPAASAAGVTSWLPDGTAGLKVSVAGKETVYTVTCAIEGPDMAETSIKVAGKNGSDTATFNWIPGKMPFVEAVTGGTAWKAEDLSATRSFKSAQAWNFNGTVNDSGEVVEGQAVCK